MLPEFLSVAGPAMPVPLPIYFTHWLVCELAQLQGLACLSGLSK